MPPATPRASWTVPSPTRCWRRSTSTSASFADLEPEMKPAALRSRSAAEEARRGSRAPHGRRLRRRAHAPHAAAGRLHQGAGRRAVQARTATSTERGPWATQPEPCASAASTSRPRPGTGSSKLLAAHDELQALRARVLLGHLRRRRLHAQQHARHGAGTAAARQPMWRRTCPSAATTRASCWNCCRSTATTASAGWWRCAAICPRAWAACRRWCTRRAGGVHAQAHRRPLHDRGGRVPGDAPAGARAWPRTCAS